MPKMYGRNSDEASWSAPYGCGANSLCSKVIPSMAGSGED